MNLYCNRFTSETARATVRGLKNPSGLLESPLGIVIIVPKAEITGVVGYRDMREIPWVDLRSKPLNWGVRKGGCGSRAFPLVEPLVPFVSCEGKK